MRLDSAGVWLLARAVHAGTAMILSDCMPKQPNVQSAACQAAQPAGRDGTQLPVKAVSLTAPAEFRPQHKHANLQLPNGWLIAGIQPAVHSLVEEVQDLQQSLCIMLRDLGACTSMPPASGQSALCLPACSSRVHSQAHAKRPAGLIATLGQRAGCAACSGVSAYACSRLKSP